MGLLKQRLQGENDASSAATDRPNKTWFSPEEPIGRGKTQQRPKRKAAPTGVTAAGPKARPSPVVLLSRAKECMSASADHEQIPFAIKEESRPLLRFHSIHVVGLERKRATRVRTGRLVASPPPPSSNHSNLTGAVLRCSSSRYTALRRRQLPLPLATPPSTLSGRIRQGRRRIRRLYAGRIRRRRRVLAEDDAPPHRHRAPDPPHPCRRWPPEPPTIACRSVLPRRGRALPVLMASPPPSRLAARLSGGGEVVL
uniref:Uncharacterized protein n=1 Tax=Oryza nivara TaxID=4536 RepID=A0A679BCG2_ORYNI|nr:hypothetical protein [Oryza sativa f. spontanea]